MTVGATNIFWWPILFPVPKRKIICKQPELLLHGPKSLELALATYCFPFRYWRWECLSKNGMSQITSRSYLSWRLELLAGHMYGIRRVIFPQTPAHVDSSFNFRLYKTFRRKNVQNFTFSTPPSSRSTFAAHGFSILSTIDSYYLNYRSVHSGFSISGFVPIELPVPPGPLSFPLCVLSLIACLSFSQSGFGGYIWNLFGEDEAALWSLRLCWRLREVSWVVFFFVPACFINLHTEPPGYTFYFLHPVVNGHEQSQKVWDVSLSSQFQGE